MILFVFTMTFCFSPLLFPVPGLRKEGKSEAKGRFFLNPSGAARHLPLKRGGVRT